VPAACGDGRKSSGKQIGATGAAESIRADPSIARSTAISALDGWSVARFPPIAAAAWRHIG